MTKKAVSIAASVYRIRLDFTTQLLGSMSSRGVMGRYLGGKAREGIAERGQALGALQEAGADVAGLSVPEVPPAGQVAQDEESLLSEMLEKGTTVFYQEEGRYFLMDYQVRGFFKSMGRQFNGLGGVKALRSKVVNYIFIKPRRISVEFPATMLVRPVVAQALAERKKDADVIGTTDVDTSDEWKPGQPVPAGWVEVPARVLYLERPLQTSGPMGERTALARSEILPIGMHCTFQVVAFDQAGITHAMLAEMLKMGEYQGIGQWRGGGMGRFVGTLELVSGTGGKAARSKDTTDEEDGQEEE